MSLGTRLRDVQTVTAERDPQRSLSPAEFLEVCDHLLVPAHGEDPLLWSPLCGVLDREDRPGKAHVSREVDFRGAPCGRRLLSVPSPFLPVAASVSLPGNGHVTQAE